jgi:hypothetical protein
MHLDPSECAVCGSPRIAWRRCKLVCVACGTIQMSCSDLSAEGRDAEPATRVPVS